MTGARLSLRSSSALAVGASLALVCLPSPAQADVPSTELLAKLAVHAAALETMRTHASCALQGSLANLDGDGVSTSKKTMTARIDADGTLSRFVILKYFEDGEDKTDDARKKAHDDEEKRKKMTAAEKDKEQIHMPFLASERARYTFDQVETDRADPARVRITFVPKVPTEQTIEGSAWVDTNQGTVLSAGFKVSKTPLFVDWIHFTLEFGAATSLGPAISKVTAEGRGGLLFIHKHFVGSATITDYRIAP